MTPNLAAFLTMLSHSEGSDRAVDSYRVCFKFSHVISSFADHPACDGEWKGESLDFLGGKYIGMISTAAGRYQINRPTWKRLKDTLRLGDFTPTSQDDAAIELIKRAGALTMVNDGRLEDAIARCCQIWASLPGGTNGQPHLAIADEQVAYEAAGGSLIAPRVDFASLLGRYADAGGSFA